MGHKAEAEVWRSFNIASALLIVCLAPMTQSYNLRKALDRKGQNGGTMLNYQEGKILFGNFFEKGRTGLPTSVHANWLGTSVAEDTIDYQADSAGPQRDISEQWQRMEPSLHCAANQMKLMAREPGASQLALAQENATPLPLSQDPSACGYSVRRRYQALTLVAPYDGCKIMQEDGCYILPMLWYGKPIMLSCPITQMEPMATVQPISYMPTHPPTTTPPAKNPPTESQPAKVPPQAADLRRPYNQWPMPPFYNNPYGQQVQQQPYIPTPPAHKPPAKNPPTECQPAKVPSKAADLPRQYNQWPMPPFYNNPYGQHPYIPNPPVPVTTTKPPAKNPPAKSQPAKVPPKAADLPGQYNQWPMPPFYNYPYGQQVQQQPYTPTPPAHTPPAKNPPTESQPAKVPPKAADLPGQYNQWPMPPFYNYPYGQQVQQQPYMPTPPPAKNPPTESQPAKVPPKAADLPRQYNQWPMPPFYNYPYGQHPYMPNPPAPETTTKPPSKNPPAKVPPKAPRSYHQWPMPSYFFNPYGQQVVH